MQTSHLFGCLDDGTDHLKEEGLEVPQRKALLSEPHRRLDQPQERQAAQAAVHGEEAGQHARRGDRADTDMEVLGGGAEVRGHPRDVCVPVAPGAGARCVDEEVVKDLRAVSALGKQKAAAAQRGQHRLGDARRRHAGKRGVEGVAAVLQDFPHRLGDQGMAAGNGAVRFGRAAHAALLGLRPARGGAWKGKAASKALAARRTMASA